MAGTFTNDEYTDMVLLYGEALENAALARRLYSQRFPERRLPSINVFKRTVMRLKIDGRFDVQPIRSRPVCDNEDTLQQVGEYFQENPTHSQKRAANELGINTGSLQTILKERSCHPYQTNQSLPRPPIDLEKLVHYCRRIINSVSENSQMVKAESGCNKKLQDSETENPQLPEVESSDCSKRELDSETVSTLQFVKVEADFDKTVLDNEIENPQLK